MVTAELGVGALERRVTVSLRLLDTVMVMMSVMFFYDLKCASV